MPARRLSTVSSVTCWEVSVRLATTRLTGPAPKRRGEIETRSVEIEPVITIRVGGRGTLRRAGGVRAPGGAAGGSGRAGRAGALRRPPPPRPGSWLLPSPVVPPPAARLGRRAEP